MMTSKSKTVIWSLLGIAVSVAALYFLVFRRSPYAPTTDTLTFERNVDKDEGTELKPTNLVSREGIRLTEVFNPSTKTFTSEGQGRYGANRSNPMGGGVGLKIFFVTKNNTKTETKEFVLPGWTAFERVAEGKSSRPQRRTEIADAGIRLAKAIGHFVAPVSIRRTFGVALDVTEGVTPALAKRVRQIIAETRAIKLGASSKNSVTLNLYNVTESPYQGGRERLNPASPEELRRSLNWLLQERPTQSRSSVLGGLKPILEEMSQSGGNSRLDIFTDGLENTDELSVYKKSELLEKSNWATMDQVANFASLKLAGLEIHLHPLPAKSARHAEMMEKGLAFLADRLTRAGAAVKVEPF